MAADALTADHNADLGPAEHERLEERARRHAAVLIVAADIAASLRARQVAIDRDDELARVDERVDARADALVVDGIDEQRVRVLRLADELQHRIDAVPFHREKLHRQAVDLVVVRRRFHAADHFVEERVALARQDHDNLRLLLARRERFRGRIRLVAELARDAADVRRRLGVDAAAPVQHAVDRAARDVAELRDFLHRYHDGFPFPQH